ncbi:MAG: carboxyl transferase domain-containing protein [Burkholderiales bacterium]
MSWQPELDEIERRRRIAAGHGGPDKVAKHRVQGRQPVRERIDAIRKAFGMAALAQRNGSPAFTRIAWPSAQWGSLPIAGGVAAAYRAVIEAAPDPAAARAEIEGRLETLQDPLRTAEAFGIEEIVDPRDTRAHLCRFANLAAPLRMAGRPRFGYRP